MRVVHVCGGVLHFCARHLISLRCNCLPLLFRSCIRCGAAILPQHILHRFTFDSWFNLFVLPLRILATDSFESALRTVNSLFEELVTLYCGNGYSLDVPHNQALILNTLVTYVLDTARKCQRADSLLSHCFGLAFRLHAIDVVLLESWLVKFSPLPSSSDMSRHVDAGQFGSPNFGTLVSNPAIHDFETIIRGSNSSILDPHSATV